MGIGKEKGNGNGKKREEEGRRGKKERNSDGVAIPPPMALIVPASESAYTTISYSNRSSPVVTYPIVFCTRV